MSENFDKYLRIANRDIQMANNHEELKSYVASILYDNDKKAELLQQKENIIKEAREYITYWHYRNDFRVNSFTTGIKEELLKILDKENKDNKKLKVISI